MPRIILLACALAVVATSPADAKDWWKDIERAGFTAGLGASVGGFNSVKNFETSTVGIENGTAGGLMLRGGYRLPRFLAVDLHFEWGNSDTEVTTTPEPSIDVEGDWITTTADIKLILPRWANSEFFGYVGPGFMNMDGRTRYATRFGFGVDVYFTRSVGLTLGGSYVMPTGSLKDLDYTMGEGGLFYRF